MEPNQHDIRVDESFVKELRYWLQGLQASGLETYIGEQYSGGEEITVEKAPEKRAAPAAAEAVSPSAARLREIRDQLGDCRRCRLHRERTNLVFGDGAANAPIVFVGEGPGRDEDRQGKPFVGRAGKLLDKIIAALGFDRDQVYICNVVKCRPPRNRNPEPDEISICSPFLVRQLEAIRPRVICTLGACASQTLLNRKVAISQLRNRIHYWRGTPLVATYHPAYLLRSPGRKAAVWQDLLLVQQILAES